MKREKIRRELSNLAKQRHSEENEIRMLQLIEQLKQADENERFIEEITFNTACIVWGVKKEDFIFGRMKREFAEVRKFVAHRLVNVHGINEVNISKLLQIKRVSVYSAWTHLERDLPFNKDLRAKWELFNELLDVSCQANDRVA